MKVIVDALRTRLEYQDKGREQIEDDLQAVLDTVLAKRTKETHQLLCGFCDAGEFYLLKSSNREISPVPVWDCIGFGDSALTRYLGAIFLENYVHLPVFRAVPICIYLIAQAKKYVTWCGGETDLIVMSPQGKVTQHRGTALLDSACDEVESCLNMVLTSATVPGAGTEYTLHLIEALRRVLEENRSVLTKFLAG